MVEFNPDGSIKITGRYAQKKNEQDNRMRNGQAIKIKKEIFGGKPKKCVLHITKSDKLNPRICVQKIYDYFNLTAETPMKLVKINDKEYQLEVGSDFKRCRECTQFTTRIKEVTNNNLILDGGSCTYNNPMNRGMSYEDYFD